MTDSTGLVLVTPPTVEPVSLAEARAHLRLVVEETSPVTARPDDFLVLKFVKAARLWAELFQNKAYLTQTFRLSMEAFPAKRYIELPRPPLQSVIALSYWDGSATQVVSFVDPSGTVLTETDDYLVDTSSQPGRLCLKENVSWPAITSRAGAVQVEYKAGHTNVDDVDEVVKIAILLRLSELYENRGDQAAHERHKSAAESFLWMERKIPI